mmetsp:Transcript_267/g.596  ORF Transcript_267/g.596 Transcript_267/m.596 type:complete len:320 (-) Transcript_267:78-1037(-)
MPAESRRCAVSGNHRICCTPMVWPDQVWIHFFGRKHCLSSTSFGTCDLFSIQERPAKSVSLAPWKSEVTRSFVSRSSPSTAFSSSFCRVTSSSRCLTSSSSFFLTTASSTKSPHLPGSSAAGTSSRSSLPSSSFRLFVPLLLSQMVLPLLAVATVLSRVSWPSGTKRAGFAAYPRLWKVRYCWSKDNALMLIFSTWPSLWFVYFCSRLIWPTGTGPCKGLFRAPTLGFVRSFLSAGLMAKFCTLSCPIRSTSGAASMAGSNDRSRPTPVRGRGGATKDFGAAPLATLGFPAASSASSSPSLYCARSSIPCSPRQWAIRR